MYYQKKKQKQKQKQKRNKKKKIDKIPIFTTFWLTKNNVGQK